MSKYHYLNSSLNNSTRQFIGVVNGEVVAHTSYINFPMVKGAKREHRLVVHPDWQGVGIGTKFQEAIASKLYNEGFSVICTTTTPALVKAMIKNKEWKLYKHGVSKCGYASLKGKEHMKATNSSKRITYSFSYKGRKVKRYK